MRAVLMCAKAVMRRRVWGSLAVVVLVAIAGGTPLGVVSLVAIVVVSISAANAIAAFPARRAARTEPATVLRSE